MKNPVISKCKSWNLPKWMKIILPHPEQCRAAQCLHEWLYLDIPEWGMPWSSGTGLGDQSFSGNASSTAQSREMLHFSQPWSGEQDQCCIPFQALPEISSPLDPLVPTVVSINIFQWCIIQPIFSLTHPIIELLGQVCQSDNYCVSLAPFTRSIGDYVCEINTLTFPNSRFQNYLIIILVNKENTWATNCWMASFRASSNSISNSSTFSLTTASKVSWVITLTMMKFLYKFMNFDKIIYWRSIWNFYFCCGRTKSARSRVG